MAVKHSRNVKPNKLHIKRGDLVVAIAGEDAAKSKPGKVLRIYPKARKALVEGYNYVKKHTRKTQDNPHGGIVDMEAPIHISNLKRYESDEPAPQKARAAATRKKKTSDD